MPLAAGERAPASLSRRRLRLDALARARLLRRRLPASRHSPPWRTCAPARGRAVAPVHRSARSPCAAMARLGRLSRLHTPRLVTERDEQRRDVLAVTVDRREGGAGAGRRERRAPGPRGRDCSATRYGSGSVPRTVPRADASSTARALDGVPAHVVVAAQVRAGAEQPPQGAVVESGERFGEWGRQVAVCTQRACPFLDGRCAVGRGAHHRRGSGSVKVWRL